MLEHFSSSIYQVIHKQGFVYNIIRFISYSSICTLHVLEALGYNHIIYTILVIAVERLKVTCCYRCMEGKLIPKRTILVLL